MPTQRGVTFKDAVAKLGFVEAVIWFWKLRLLASDFFAELTFEQARSIWQNTFFGGKFPALRRRVLKVLESTAKTVSECEDVYRYLPKKEKERRRAVLERMFVAAEKVRVRRFGTWVSLYYFCCDHGLWHRSRQCLEKLYQFASRFEDWQELCGIAKFLKDKTLLAMALSGMFKSAAKDHPLKVSNLKTVPFWEEMYDLADLARPQSRLRRQIKRWLDVLALNLVDGASTTGVLLRLITRLERLENPTLNQLVLAQVRRRLHDLPDRERQRVRERLSVLEP